MTKIMLGASTVTLCVLFLASIVVAARAISIVGSESVLIAASLHQVFLGLRRQGAMNVDDITMEEPNIQAGIKYCELKLLKINASPRRVSESKRSTR